MKKMSTSSISIIFFTSTLFILNQRIGRSFSKKKFCRGLRQCQFGTWCSSMDFYWLGQNGYRKFIIILQLYKLFSNTAWWSKNARRFLDDSFVLSCTQYGPGVGRSCRLVLVLISLFPTTSGRRAPWYGCEKLYYNIHYIDT